MQHKPGCMTFKSSRKFGRLADGDGNEFEIPHMPARAASATPEATLEPAAEPNADAAPRAIVSWHAMLCLSACAGAITTGIFLFFMLVSIPNVGQTSPTSSPPGASSPPRPPPPPLWTPPPPDVPPVDRRRRGTYVGGCRTPWPRADYAVRTGCNGTLACKICGSLGHSCDNTVVTLPSGMQFPRHNVPQFAGNAVWDGPALDLGGAVRAMLGSPFDFAVSPEMHALELVFAGLGHREVAEELRVRWHDEPRYPAYEMARGSRRAFLSAMSRLTAHYVFSHPSWRSLAPHSVRQQIETMAGTRDHSSASRPAATCAAAIILDGAFARKSTFDIWVTSLMASGALSRNAEADPTTLMRQLYVLDSPSEESLEVDPSSEIYTTPYQVNANGFYAGNLTFIYKSSQEGSGVDTQFLASRSCPGPAPQGQTEATWHREWCRAREEDGVLEFARSNGDAGEIRTANYKAPHEVDGALFFDWPPAQSAWTSANAFDFDLSTLARPLHWGFYRAWAASRTASPTTTELVLVVAPGLVPGGVYGILSRPEGSTTKFVATKPPPETLGSERADHEIAPGVPFSTLDRAVAQVPERAVPVWGVLHRCTSTNLLSATLATVDVPDGTVGRGRFCAAARLLARHTASGPLAADAALRQAVEQATLPNEIVEHLTRQRVWPSTAFVDLASSADVISSNPPDAVCSLSLSALGSAAVRTACLL
jgi:hypothetical protein